jgi:transcriptional regulator with XRE-family HTH domain
MSLSEKLRNLRDHRGWSQQYLADRMKVDRSTISRYETGKSIPTYQTVIRFAEVFQINKDFLIEELDQMLPTAEKQGYILKESLNDQDLEIALKLIQQEPELKKILLDIQLMDSNRRAFFIEKMKAELKVLKKFKRI